ncbi:MAG: hypothetical protein DRG78_00680 [Epsilonproteobacteria bacterium]|nr:MAG: hypothetical protein DRG78_00680 [Campylobacterota bacterium]
MKDTQKNKRFTNKELSKRFNITEQTYNNWKKNKPELIKIIELGLDFENILQNYNIENSFNKLMKN